jgi:hypothetical protein
MRAKTAPAAQDTLLACRIVAESSRTTTAAAAKNATPTPPQPAMNSGRRPARSMRRQPMVAPRQVLRGGREGSRGLSVAGCCL